MVFAGMSLDSGWNSYGVRAACVWQVLIEEGPSGPRVVAVVEGGVSRTSCVIIAHIYGFVVSLTHA
jgi:hypothetical protein